METGRKSSEERGGPGINGPGWIHASVASLVSLGLAVQLCSCGTLLYPERVGQRGGRIDPGVAILDGIGLLFFILPGAIAFAVDFSNGAIYLPRGQGAVEEDESGEGYLVITPKTGVATKRELEVALEERLGRRVDLGAADVQVVGWEKLKVAKRSNPFR